MKTLNNNADLTASVTLKSLMIYIAITLAIPVVLLMVGIFVPAIDRLVSLFLIAAATISLLMLVPHVLGFRLISLREDQIVAKSLFGSTRIFSTSELHYVRVSLSNPVIATLHFLDGSKIAYLPITTGVQQDITEPTKRLIELADANRDSLARK